MMKQVTGIGHDGDISHFHHGRLGVFVYRNDETGFPQARSVLNGAADAKGKQNFRLDMFSCLADQRIMSGPAGVNHWPRRTDISA